MEGLYDGLVFGDVVPRMIIPTWDKRGSYSTAAPSQYYNTMKCQENLLVDRGSHD